MIQLGQRIGNFEIVERLGAGGMGEVFRARDAVLGRDVAVKAVRDWSENPGRLERLRREARILASLNHPSIASIYGLEQEGGVPLLILELVEGPTLAERLRNGPLLVVEAMSIARAAADALSYAHLKGVVHRDFKPANIKCAAPGHVKLLDFGLARLTDGDGQSSADDATASLTADGAVFGTAPYMSPEQARGGVVDRKTDIWAYGCVLFEMLTGSRAFASIAAVIESEPEWARLPVDVPAEVRSLLQSCLQKDPAKRPHDLSAASDSITGVVDDLRRGQRPKRAPWKAIAIVVLAVLVVAAAGMPLWTRSATAPGSSTAVAPTAAAIVPFRRSIATLDLSNLSRSADREWISTALREVIGSHLWADQGIRLITGEAVSRMSGDLSLAASEAYTLDTLTRIHSHIGADLVVAGSYLATDQRLQVSVVVQDASSGETIARVTEAGGEHDLIQIGSRIGEQLRRALGLNAVAVTATGVPAGAAAQAYAQGLTAFRRFEFVMARQHLQAALQAAPDSVLVNLAYARALTALGYDVMAREHARRALDAPADMGDEQRLRLRAEAGVVLSDHKAAVGAYGELWRRHPDDVLVAVAFADAQRRANERPAALATIASIRETIPGAADDPAVLLVEARVASDINELARANDLAARAGTLARARGAREQVAAAFAEQSRVLSRLGKYRESIDASREAQRNFEAAGNRAGVADALGTIGIAMFYLGDFEGQRRLHEQELTVARAIGARRAEARSLANIAMVDSLTGRLEAALQGELATLAIRRELQDGNAITNNLHNIGELRQSLGQLDEADASYQAAIELARKVNARMSEVYSISGRGDVAAARGDFPAAQRAYEEAIAAREQAKQPPLVAASRLALATAQLDAGAFGEADKNAGIAVAAFAAANDPARQAWALGFQAAAAQKQGDRTRALKLLDEGRPLVEKASYVRAKLTFAMNEARILATSGTAADVARARRVLVDALAEATRTGYVNRQLELRVALGEVELAATETRSAGLARLAVVEKEARARGYKHLADTAAAFRRRASTT